MDIPEQLPELSGKMRMHHLRPDPALREILLPHLAAGQHGPVRVKINSSLLFIVLEHLALHAVRQKVGPLQLADDPVIALQADLSLLVRSPDRHTADCHLPFRRVVPGILYLDNLSCADTVFYRHINVVIVACVDPAVPVGVALLRRNIFCNAHNPAHDRICVHLAFLGLRIQTDLPEPQIGII